jgi:flagellar biosynthesis/type III secretory pathway M-ring protein FliF/YscJ
VYGRKHVYRVGAWTTVFERRQMWDKEHFLREGDSMSTIWIVVIVVVAVVLIACLAFAASRGRTRKLEQKRLEAREHREVADTKARKAEQARLQAEEQADRARKQQAEADELRRHAAEVDPDTETPE